MRQFVMHLGDNFAKFLPVTQSGSDRAKTAKFCRFPWPLQTGFRNVVFRASSIAFRRRANCRTLSGPCTCLSKPTADAKMRKTDVLLDTTAIERSAPARSIPSRPLNIWSPLRPTGRVPAFCSHQRPAPTRRDALLCYQRTPDRVFFLNCFAFQRSEVKR